MSAVLTTLAALWPHIAFVAVVLVVGFAAERGAR